MVSMSILHLLDAGGEVPAIFTETFVHFRKLDCGQEERLVQGLGFHVIRKKVANID